MRIVFDIEANGLYKTVDTLWCICLKDLDSQWRGRWHRPTAETIEKRYTSESLDDISLIKTLNTAEVLIGHNIINYDLHVLKKILGWEPNENTKIVDTLVMSRLANPDRGKPPGYTGRGGPHSLEAWGYRLGKGKLDHEEWSFFSPAMLRRCEEDVEITDLVYHTVSNELKEFSEESISLEHEVYKIISKQEHRGIRFNTSAAEKMVLDLSKRIDKIDKEIVPLLPKELEVIGVEVRNPFLKTGGYRKTVIDYIESTGLGKDVIEGPFTRVRFHMFNIGSVGKVKDFLIESGWIPDSYNYSKKTGERTSPKLEGDFIGISGVIPINVKDRITWRHRRSQIEGWITNAEHINASNDDDNNSDYYVLHPGANTCGTPTGRFRHFEVVNIPRASSDKETKALIWDTNLQASAYGTQMRSLFIPREGYKIVGHDASGIELRMLAHYMGDEEFIYQILHGDIHTFNQEKAGLPTRDAAKTFIYALIYGAGDAKIGSIVNGTAEDGKRIKEEYFKALPKLKAFIEKVKRASGKGYLIGLDGRHVQMRRDDSGRIARSKAPNTLLQSAAAVVMKKSCVLLWELVEANNVDAHKILDMHDEGQSEVIDNKEQIELYSELAVNSIRLAGEHFNLRIPLDAEVKVGMNLAETH